MVTHQQTNLQPVLYKYRDWNNCFHRLTIEKQLIQLSSPRKFNDPFDCAPTVTIEGSKIVEESINNSIFREHGNVSENERLKIRAEVLADPDYTNEKWREEKNDEFINYINKSCGVFCLTKEQDNILMWSNYSDNHRGFVIGFDTDKILNNSEVGNKRLVTYVDKVLPVNIDELNNVTQETIFNMIYTKSDKWHHEKEFRTVKTYAADKVIQLTKDYFKEIIIGYCMPPDDEEKLIIMIKNHLPDVPLFKAKRNRYEFKMDIEPLFI